MRADPPDQDYLHQRSALYERENYNGGLAGFFMSRSHKWCEQDFGTSCHFSRVLEVGAGTGVHLKYVRHSFDEYIVTDIDPLMLQRAVGQSTHRGQVLI